MSHELFREAWENCMVLDRIYAGLLIVIGRANTGQVVLVSGMTSRRPMELQRFYRLEGERVRTQFAEPQSDDAAKYRIYDAIVRRNHCWGVGNGDHVDGATHFVSAKSGSLQTALRYTRAEEDGLATPRLMGLYNPKGAWRFELGILLGEKTPTAQRWYQWDEMPLGYGQAIWTYNGDPSTPKPNPGGPVLLPLVGSTAQEVALNLYHYCNHAYRVATAVVFIDPETGGSTVGIRNRHAEVVSAA